MVGGWGELGFPREQNPHHLRQPWKCVYFDKAHQLHKENQILINTAPNLSSFVQYLFFFFCHGSNWHRHGKCAHRRILIYWCFLPLLYIPAPIWGNGWSRCLTLQHLFITSLFKTSFTSTYSYGFPLTQEAEVIVKHEAGAGAWTHVLCSWASIFRARDRFMKQP